MSAFSKIGVMFACLFMLHGITSGSAVHSEGDGDTREALRLSLQQIEELRARAAYEDGLALAREALGEAEELGDNSLLTEALYQISLIYYFLEDFEDARAYMEIGLTHARLHGLKTKEADLLNAQGVLEWKQGNLHEAIAKLEQALEIRKANEDWISLASIANNLGIIRYSMQDFSEAVRYYEMGLEWLSDGQNDRLRSSLFSNLGESLIPLGRFEEAEFFLLQSLEIEETADEPLALAYTYFNLGELRSGQGLRDEAIRFYEKALGIQQRIDNDWSASLTRLRIAREYRLVDQPEKALEELLAGYEAAKELNALTILRDYCEELSGLYEILGKTGKADYYATLKEWIVVEIERESPSGGELIADVSIGDIVRPKPPNSPFDMSAIRVATLGLLILLVFILIIENMRLRRLSRGD